MTKITEQEMCRIAASIRLTGELLEATGSRAYVSSESWQRGPQSPSLEPNRSDRYELVNQGTPDEFAARVPGDTTGEAAMTADPYEFTSARFLNLVRLVDKTTTELRNMMYAASPQITQPEVFEPDTPAQVSAAGWCVSCWRDSHYLEPVAMRPDGSRRYRDFCSWCGIYVAEAKKRQMAEPKAKRKKKAKQPQPDLLPPLDLVKARHRGDRITQQMVEAAEGRRKAS